MKRRNVSVLLAAMLVLFLFPCAHADQNIQYEIADESMIDENVYSGTWQTIGKVYDMYVPDGWKVSDPTDVEYASGVLAKICDPTGKFVVITSYISGKALESAGLTELGTIAATLEKDPEISDATLYLLNGIPCVNYYITTSDAVVTAFFADSALIQVSMAPASPEQFIPFAINMFYSIRPIAEAEEASEAAE